MVSCCRGRWIKGPLGQCGSMPSPQSYFSHFSTSTFISSVLIVQNLLLITTWHNVGPIFIIGYSWRWCNISCWSRLWMLSALMRSQWTKPESGGGGLTAPQLWEEERVTSNLIIIWRSSGRRRFEEKAREFFFATSHWKNSALFKLLSHVRFLTSFSLKRWNDHMEKKKCRTNVSNWGNAKWKKHLVLSTSTGALAQQKQPALQCYVWTQFCVFLSRRWNILKTNHNCFPKGFCQCKDERTEEKRTVTRYQEQASICV